MNLSDKDLDRLFREASDRFEPDDSMLSWNRLEKNLAGQLPERPPGPPRRFGLRPMVWVPAAVLFAGLSFFLIKNHQPYRSLSTLPPSTVTAPVSPASDAGHPHGLTTSPSAPERSGTDGTARTAVPAEPASGSIPASSALHANEADTKKENSGGPATRAEKTSSAAGSNSDASHAALTGKNNRNPANHDTNPDPGAVYERQNLNTNWGHRDNAAMDPGGNGSRTRKDKAGNIFGTRRHSPTAGEDENDGTGSNPDSFADSAAVVKENRIADAGTAPANYAANTREKAEIIPARPGFARAHLPSLNHSGAPSFSGNDDALNKEAMQQKKLPLPSRSVHIRQPLTLGLVMGPDYTDGGVTNSQFGNSLGISVSYYLSSRLSINSGILYGVKSYSARGRDFQPRREPLRNFGSYPHIESANGTVTQFEIPLSLRYDFPLDSKTRLFLNSGLSSYLPVKETFTTYFHDQGRIYGWRHVDNNPPSHWFAIGHFSGGVERDLGKGISFQAEPFFNLPFTNVCAGNVKLNTYGLLFSIRYTPVLGRKKG